jgi:glycosyltransferase involved in cell wall biosynthesis
MRILMGVHGLPPGSIGGTELSALRLAKALAVRHDVTLFHPLIDPALPVGAELVRHDRGVRIVGRVLPAPARFEDTWRLPGAEAWFQRLLARFQPDVCHLHHLTGLSVRLPALARAVAVPTVLTLHDYWLACARGQRMNLEIELCPGPRADRCAVCLADQIALDRFTGRLLRPLIARVRPPAAWLELGKRLYGRARMSAGPAAFELTRAQARIDDARGALEAATLLTAPSRHLLETVRGMVPTAAPLWFVDHGLEARAPSPPPPPPPTPLRVGFLGAMIPTKGPDLLLRAVEGFHPQRLKVSLMGPSPSFHRQPDYLPRLRAAARARGIELLPPASPEAVTAWIRTQHVLVVPSIWPENAPLVIAEAFREGVPVIASDIGGIPERVVDDVNGRLLPPGDLRALAATIGLLIDTPETLERWRQGAWNTPLPGLEEQVGRWEEIYASAIASRPFGGMVK